MSYGVLGKCASGGTKRGLRLCILHAAEDRVLRGELAAHLSALIYQREVKLLDGAGAREVDQAEIIVALLSASLLGEAVSRGGQLGRALRRTQRGWAWLVPVLARPVDLLGSPFGGLALLPGDQRPIKGRANRDQGWLLVVNGLRELINMLPRSGAGSP